MVAEPVPAEVAEGDIIISILSIFSWAGRFIGISRAEAVHWVEPPVPAEAPL